LIFFLEWLNRLIALPLLKIEVSIPPDDLARLRGLPRDVGLLVASNHPSYSDPFVVFEMSRRWGRYCTWMAARELFSRMGGWMGSFIRRSGAFSVWRGGHNHDAAAFVRHTLDERRFPVVIFPEGHTFYLNDVLLPLKPGIAAWAIDAALEHPRLPVWILPLVIKYRYTEDIRAQLDRAVSRMEAMVLRRAEPVPPGEFWSRLYIRLHRIADVILSRQERLHHYHAARPSDIDDRVHGLCATIIRRLELRYLGQEASGDFFDRARVLMARLKDDDDPQHQKDALDARFAWALSTFYAGYLSPDSTPERFAETVMKLLRELTHRVPLSFRAWRTAHVRVGEPIDVRSMITGADLSTHDLRRAMADRVLEVLTERMRSLLDPAPGHDPGILVTPPR
jgi:1-acyl-sn-glycerol-3-phosphate acyltransferase